MIKDAQKETKLNKLKGKKKDFYVYVHQSGGCIVNTKRSGSVDVFMNDSQLAAGRSNVERLSRGVNARCMSDCLMSSRLHLFIYQSRAAPYFAADVV